MGSQPFRLTGSIPQGLPAFRPPHFSLAVPNGTVPFQSMVEDMGVGLAVVPLMGLLETIAIAKAFASQSGYRIDPNQELLALGVANVLGSFVSSYPITGSFGRTAVNAQSGVCTPAGGLVTGALVLLSLAYLTSLFYYIPKAALAAVIISAVVPMFDAGIFRTLWRVKRLDLVPLCVTFLLCFWEVQYGIMAGVLVSGILLLYSIARPPIKVSEGAVLLVQLGSSLHFPAVEHLRDSVCSRALAAASPPRSVILDCCHVSSIDYTVVVGLSELLQELRRHGLSLAFCGLKVCGTSATPPQAQGGCVLRGSAQLPSPVACADLSSGGTVIISSTFISQSWRLRMQGAGKGWVLCAGMAGGSAPEGWEVASTPPAQVSLPSGPCSPGPPVCRLRRIPAFPQLGGGRAVRGSGAGGQRGRALHQHCREHGAHPVR
ncbi:sodium-independent sulfate anion transporter isoform 4-T4 [Cyanocitta cristata]